LIGHFRRRVVSRESLAPGPARGPDGAIFTKLRKRLIAPDGKPSVLRQFVAGSAGLAAGGGEATGAAGKGFSCAFGVSAPSTTAIGSSQGTQPHVVRIALKLSLGS